MLTMPCIENWDHVFDMIISFFLVKLTSPVKSIQNIHLIKNFALTPKQVFFMFQNEKTFISRCKWITLTVINSS